MSDYLLCRICKYARKERRGVKVHNILYQKGIWYCINPKNALSFVEQENRNSGYSYQYIEPHSSYHYLCYAKYFEMRLFYKIFGKPIMYFLKLKRYIRVKLATPPKCYLTPPECLKENYTWGKDES